MIRTFTTWSNPAKDYFKERRRKTYQTSTDPQASTSSNIEPSAPPAPTAPPEKGPPSSLLDQIRKGTGLKPTETKDKSGFIPQEKIEEPSSLLEQIKQAKK